MYFQQLDPAGIASDDTVSLEDSSAVLTEAVDDNRQSVAETQVVNAIQHAIEADLLRPSYLESEPYLRLGLRRSFHWLPCLMGDRNGRRTTIPRVPLLMRCCYFFGLVFFSSLWPYACRMA